MPQETIRLQDYKTPVGDLILGVHRDQVVMADWKYRAQRQKLDERLRKKLNAVMEFRRAPLHDQIESQLEEYFVGDRKSFDLPLLLLGTDFQNLVWNALLDIPYGTSESYLSLSRKLNIEKSIRAVASANGANVISIIIPCHRIIGRDGKLVGYAGGLPAKKKLLLKEGALIERQYSLF